MMTSYRWLSSKAISILLLGWAFWTQAAEDIPTTLIEYAAKPDRYFAWQVVSEQADEAGRWWQLELTSQKWRDYVWKHVLLVFEPPTVEHPNHMILFITGGAIGSGPRRGDMLVGRALAAQARARVAVLQQVPNQPLLDNRSEDDLISETWLRYLETGDITWVLQLPMATSAVRAMDALQQFARQRNLPPVAGFVVTGASKRGWTTWLAAVADQRVVGIAPIVFNVLNLQPQMRYQLQCWGEYSKQIEDYTRKGLVHDNPLTERELTLHRLVDPYTYRAKLSLPKLLVHGTNDPYWVAEAANLYFDDLVGPKYLLEIPNADHGLRGGQELAISTIAAFFRHVVGGKPWPEIRWQYHQEPEFLRLEVSSSIPPEEARVWIAQAPSTDFRQARWESQPMERAGENYRARVAKPASAHVAVYAILYYQMDGLPYALSTLIHRD
jgi:PhoPQ-activated pathogenicity-related protein